MVEARCTHVQIFRRCVSSGNEHSDSNKSLHMDEL